MIYDCFLFNDELELLALRLEYLFDTVDYFVIVESRQTFSSLAKPLHFQENRQKFEKFESKIIHVVCGDNVSETDAWPNEHYQRNCIKLGLGAASDQDIVIVGDVDEFINVDHIHLRTISRPTIIQLYYHYYFLNLFSKMYNEVVLVSPYGFIKEKEIGNRLDYQSFVQDILKAENAGWHFSYLFGYRVDSYINKLKSFSHQEYNNSYYTDPSRISLLLKYGIDLFEREYLIFQGSDLKEILSERLLKAVLKLGMDKKYTFHAPKPWEIRSLKEVRLLVKYLKYIFLPLPGGRA